MYLKLFELLYADDTVVFATSEESLIQSLHLFSNYYNQWKLDIIYDKTKVLVLDDGVNRQRHIRIENYMIEILNEYKYLGFIFHKNRKFSSMKKHVTPSVMLYGDLGRVTLSISIKKRVIGYWYDIINSDNKLSSILYRLILQDNVHNGHSYQWLKFVKTIFNDSGHLYVAESIL